MKQLLMLCAVAMFMLPAWGADVTDRFPVTIDCSFNIYHGSTSVEGYSNSGSYSTMCLDKGHSQLGFMDWDGTVGVDTGKTLGDFLNDPGGGGCRAAYLWVHASGAALTQKAAIMTLRCYNQGNVVEDVHGNNAQYNGGAGSTGVDITSIPGKSEAVAFRMADTELKSAFPPGNRYANNGAGIDQYAMGQFAGEPWRRPSTGGSTRSGSLTFRNYDPCMVNIWTIGTAYRGFWDGELWGVEGVVGFHWSQASNTVTQFEESGQLVNKDADGNFLCLDPATMSMGNNWYRVPINRALIYDIAGNGENKGLVFSSWVAGVKYGTNFDMIDTREGAAEFCPYLEITTPEPMTLTLLALGGLALISRRRA